MKKNLLKLILVSASSLLVFINHASAQSLNVEESAYIASQINELTNHTQAMCGNGIKCFSPVINQFYTFRSFTPAWTDNGKLLGVAKNFIKILNTEPISNGLVAEYYRVAKINALAAQLDESASVDNAKLAICAANLDLLLTDAFLTYASDLSSGRINNQRYYPSWQIVKRKVDLVALLNNSLSLGNTQSALDKLDPVYPEYNQLKRDLAVYQKMALNGQEWESIAFGPKLKRGDKGSRVLALQKRLLVTGELTALAQDGIYDQALESAVTKFQTEHGLKPDGMVGKYTLNQLNLPLNYRIKQIALNMDRMRWLPDSLGNRYVLVNLPDYGLSVMQDSKAVLTMPVIIGTVKKPSCVLSSQITYLEINPYWNVPSSIAVKEMLPKLREDPDYLERNDMQVFEVTGGKARIIDPATIDWGSISSGNFNFRIRQNPSEINALGKIKFMFQNNCGIYLHDTPTRRLFTAQRRGYSHGCIRIGKPIDFATYLLQDKKSWTEKSILNEINTGSRKVVTLPEPINIYIVYYTAWVDDNNVLQFRDDIYNSDAVPFATPLLKS